jgi:hypothetical protein
MRKELLPGDSCNISVLVGFGLYERLNPSLAHRDPLLLGHLLVCWHFVGCLLNLQVECIIFIDSYYYLFLFRKIFLILILKLKMTWRLNNYLGKI